MTDISITGQRLTWSDVRRASNVVVITLRDERMARLVEVAAPLTLTRTLDQAVANLPSDASIR